jgi:hypothetical protein
VQGRIYIVVVRFVLPMYGPITFSGDSASGESELLLVTGGGDSYCHGAQLVGAEDGQQYIIYTHPQISSHVSIYSMADVFWFLFSCH